MKKLLYLIPLLALLLPACVTNRNTAGTVESITFLGLTVYPTNIYQVARDGSRTGALYGMKQDTNVAAWLEGAYQILNEGLASTNFDPSALTAAINRLPVGKMDPLALSAVTSVLTELSFIFPNLDAKAAATNPFILPAFYGIRDGIAQALGKPLGMLREFNLEPRTSNIQHPSWGIAGLMLPWRFRARKKKGSCFLPSTILSLTTLLLLSGCTLGGAYPKTEIAGTIAGHPFHLRAPKDYDLQNFEATVDTNGTMHIHIDSLKSSLSTSNLTAVANGQAQIVTAIGAVAHQAVQDAIDTAVKLGAKAVAP